MTVKTCISQTVVEFSSSEENPQCSKEKRRIQRLQGREKGEGLRLMVAEKQNASEKPYCKDPKKVLKSGGRQGFRSLVYQVPFFLVLQPIKENIRKVRPTSREVNLRRNPKW
jgi:hypothetical protein